MAALWKPRQNPTWKSICSAGKCCLLYMNCLHWLSPMRLHHGLLLRLILKGKPQGLGPASTSTDDRASRVLKSALELARLSLTDLCLFIILLLPHLRSTTYGYHRDIKIFSLASPCGYPTHEKGQNVPYLSDGMAWHFLPTRCGLAAVKHGIPDARVPNKRSGV